MPNDEYIDPHDSLPYQYGNVEDRKNIKDIQKHIASELRKAEADKFKDKGHILAPSTSRNNCKDEIIKERNGKVVKDTNLWDSPQRRKRVFFE